jgi:hypothetical protein
MNGQESKEIQEDDEEENGQESRKTRHDKDLDGRQHL